jgi:hypothetical protein
MITLKVPIRPVITVLASITLTTILSNVSLLTYRQHRPIKLSNSLSMSLAQETMLSYITLLALKTSKPLLVTLFVRTTTR